MDSLMMNCKIPCSTTRFYNAALSSRRAVGVCDLYLALKEFFLINITSYIST